MTSRPRRGRLDEFAGIEAAENLGVALVVAGAFDEHALAFGDDVGQGKDGLGGEATVGASDINSAYNGCLTSEKALFSGVRMGLVFAGAHNRSNKRLVTNESTYALITNSGTALGCRYATRKSLPYPWINGGLLSEHLSVGRTPEAQRMVVPDQACL